MTSCSVLPSIHPCMVLSPWTEPPLLLVYDKSIQWKWCSFTLEVRYSDTLWLNLIILAQHLSWWSLSWNPAAIPDEAGTLREHWGSQPQLNPAPTADNIQGHLGHLAWPTLLMAAALLPFVIGTWDYVRTIYTAKPCWSAGLIALWRHCYFQLVVCYTNTWQSMGQI